MKYKIRKCEQCGKLAHCKRRFCSLKCYWKWMKGRPNNSSTKFKKGHLNPIKGKKLTPERYEQLKMAGFFKPKFGKDSGNWKNGATKLGTAIRGLKKYRDWRMKVFTRDNFTCQECERRRKKGDRVVIQAHHLKDFYLILIENNIETTKDALKCKELWDISNGQTLCKKCHKLTDSYLLNQYTIPKIVQLKSPLIKSEAQ